MGCTSSKQQSSRPIIRLRGDLSLKDLEKRRISTDETISTNDLEIAYAYVTQRGYYPRERSKPNQDGCIVQTTFGGDKNISFFAVFDGHGQSGHFCARFCVKALPKNIEKEMRKYETENLDYGAVLTSACHMTNEELRKSDINDMHSGTTCCAMLIVGDKCYVANVGDSRAIVARKRRSDDRPPEANINHFQTATLPADAVKDTSNRLIAKPLSYDQTPFRKDERERVKKCGARVLTAQQLDGSKKVTEDFEQPGENEFDKEGDPPRIWLKHRDSPGTAFSRSFGDAEAESVGVVGTPEIEVHEVRPEDNYIIIATDGVFEFLTNQNVVDVAQAFVDPAGSDSDDVLKACEAITLEAYAQWMEFDIRSDDITAIMLHIKRISSSSSSSPISRRASVDIERYQGVKSVGRHVTETAATEDGVTNADTAGQSNSSARARTRGSIALTSVNINIKEPDQE